MRRPPAVGIWATGLLAAIAFAVGYVKHKDQDNLFCIACHLHEDLYRQTVADPPPTLAAAHYRAESEGAGANSVQERRPGAGHPERCFTCHSGEGVMGWSQVTLLSAWDAARWVLGDRHEPTSMRLPIENAACLKCHAADIRGTRSAEETGKYHELVDHRAVATRCVSCHVTHDAGERSRYFLDDATVRPRCQACHRDLGAD